MKALIFSVCILCVSASVFCQDYTVRTAFVQFNTSDQDAVNLSDTFSESIVSSGTQEGTIVISGFYPGILSDSTTSVREGEIITGIEAFPNPVSDGLILEAGADRTSPYEIRIYALDGKLVFSTPWRSEEPRLLIDFRPFSQGQYALQVMERASGRQYSVLLTHQ